MLSCWQYSYFSSCWKQHVYKHALFCLSNSSPDSNLFTTQFRFFNKSNKKIKEHKNGSVDPAGEVQRGRAERAVVHFVLQPSSDPADWAGQRSDGAAESGDTFLQQLFVHPATAVPQHRGFHWAGNFSSQCLNRLTFPTGLFFNLISVNAHSEVPLN